MTVDESAPPAINAVPLRHPWRWVGAAVIIVLVLWAALSGMRQGLITAGLSLIGAVGGAILALRLAPLVMGQLSDTGARVALDAPAVGDQ